MSVTDLSAVCSECREGNHSLCNGINSDAPATSSYLCQCETCWGEDG
jgi:hypothetical protein